MYYQERSMHAIASLLAAGHLNDLLREADNERRAALIRSGRPASVSPLSRLRGRVSSALGRDRESITAANRTPQVCA
jgi:hypothetical protein